MPRGDGNDAAPLELFVLLPDGTKHARGLKRALSLPRQVTVQDALTEIATLWGLPKPDADKIEAVELRLAAKRDGPHSFHGRAAATAALFRKGARSGNLFWARASL